MKLLRSRALTLNLSVTNGSSHYEPFGTTSERETNVFKTVTGRMAYESPVGAGLEIGASGMVGAEDLQRRNDVLRWQYGFDLHLQVRDFELSGEFVQGKIEGLAPVGVVAQERGSLRGLGGVGQGDGRDEIVELRDGRLGGRSGVGLGGARLGGGAGERRETDEGDRGGQEGEAKDAGQAKHGALPFSKDRASAPQLGPHRWIHCDCGELEDCEFTCDRI